MAIDEFSNVYVTASSEGYEIDWDWVEKHRTGLVTYP